MSSVLVSTNRCKGESAAVVAQFDTEASQTRLGAITKQGSSFLRFLLVQAAARAQEQCRFFFA